MDARSAVLEGPARREKRPCPLLLATSAGQSTPCLIQQKKAKPLTSCTRSLRLFSDCPRLCPTARRVPANDLIYCASPAQALPTRSPAPTGYQAKWLHHGAVIRLSCLASCLEAIAAGLGSCCPLPARARGLQTMAMRVETNLDRLPPPATERRGASRHRRSSIRCQVDFARLAVFARRAKQIMKHSGSRRSLLLSQNPDASFTPSETCQCPLPRIRFRLTCPPKHAFTTPIILSEHSSARPGCRQATAARQLISVSSCSASL